MPRDAVSRTLNVGTVGKNGLKSFRIDFSACSRNGFAEKDLCFLSNFKDYSFIHFMSSIQTCFVIHWTYIICKLKEIWSADSFSSYFEPNGINLLRIWNLFRWVWTYHEWKYYDLKDIQLCVYTYVYICMPRTKHTFK